MPLSLVQIKARTIVDWNIEWKKDCSHEKCSNHLKEVPRNPIRRGMIVRVEGDPSMEGGIEGIWVTFGPDLGKDKFEFNGVTVNCQKVHPKELNLVWDSEHSVSRAAWDRLFNVPKDVGTIFESRTARGQKPKTVDALQLTGAPSQGPISDGPKAIKGDED